ncbi:MAG: hypothetical protein CMJ79_13330 [Planctomycetaceae bacterium]|nr:hypothetical protein [Planctomycetaceae bacterium]|tara:strand:+ start:147 stop:1517 length:1371 start_codon:yes stop_codon:yes gene_type:complete
MCIFQKLSIHILLLVICPSLPCLAQDRSDAPDRIVNAEPVNPMLISALALPEGLKDAEEKNRVFEFGGEFRMRYHHENNHRPSPTLANSLGLTGTDDDFLLYRTRLWMDGKFNDHLNLYVEMLDAESTLENFPARGNEVDRLDLHQAYADITLNDRLQAKVGRRSLDIGSTRLVGEGEWANTRRAFDGLQLSLENENFDLEAYYLHPLSMQPNDFNQTNYDVRLYGVNTHQQVNEDITRSYYWLTLELDNTGARYDTFGAHSKGARGDLLYEFEGGVQAGINPDQTNHLAGLAVIGLGTELKGKIPGQLWVYYEWASGSDTPGNGWHHYFPRAHRHLGYIDLFGRRNLNDVNVRWDYQPTESLELRVHYHYFSLANSADVPYNTNMTPFAGLGANTSGSSSLGHEIDLLATLKLNERLKFQLGYSHFFAGAYYQTTPGVPHSGDARFFYTQMSLEF